jgi:hypothetical protein
MKKNQDGQSTIEFIFCFIFAVSLILMVFNTSLNYAAGYVTHYATFMASRVYLTYDNNQADWNGSSNNNAVQAANEMYVKFKLDVFGIQPTALTIQDFGPTASSGEFLMTGAISRFERSMDMVGKITGETKLELISESFLGREITRGVCAGRTCYAITGQDQCSESTMDITLYDDGC